MTTPRRIVDLLNELETYRARYRGVQVPAEIERMNMAIGRRRQRVDVIRRRLTELIDEMSRLEAEMAGCHKGYEALLVDAIQRIQIEHHEAWSPFPMIGYRMWAWRDGGLHGARERWKTVSKQASCRHPGDLPHSDGRCGRLGCGVYATKSLAALLDSLEAGAHGYVAGVVELTGKVVEHELGYRAERAEVRAGVMVGATHVAFVHRPDDLDRMFSDPDGHFATGGMAWSADPTEQVGSLLSEFERSRPWISDRRSA